MTGIVDPLKALEMWSDHPLYPWMRQQTHPSSSDLFLNEGNHADDIVCMTALVAMIRCSNLVIVDAQDVDHLRNVLARCYAVAEACGRVTSTYTSGAQTIVRFEKQSVSA